jgi:hypothetical protein
MYSTLTYVNYFFLNRIDLDNKDKRNMFFIYNFSFLKIKINFKTIKKYILYFHLYNQTCFYLFYIYFFITIY